MVKTQRKHKQELLRMRLHNARLATCQVDVGRFVAASDSITASYQRYWVEWANDWRAHRGSSVLIWQGQPV